MIIMIEYLKNEKKDIGILLNRWWVYMLILYWLMLDGKLYRLNVGKNNIVESWLIYVKFEM